MKVLHIWEIAGVATTLSKYLKPHGYECKVICSDKGDPFKFTENHINHNKPLTGVMLSAEARKYDILHVHFHDGLLPWLRSIYPSKPIIMHYHGSDCRGKDRSRFYDVADHILYSTKNLQPYLPIDAEYFPNPVDTQLFQHRTSFTDEDTGLYFRYNADADAEEIADRNGVKLRVMERSQPYATMPRIISQQRYYISAKRDAKGTLLISSQEDTGSLTELQALATGCTILRVNCTRTGLPPEHRAETAAEKLAEIYGEFLK